MLNKRIEQISNLGFSFENMYKRFSFISVLPIQANSNYEKQDDGTEIFWFQLVSNYKNTYSRTDEKGEIHDDNATIKTLVIKFPKSYISSQGLNVSDVKDFFEKNYVGKKFITLPVDEERPKFNLVDKKRVLVKNATECTIDESFNLKDLINPTKK